MFAQAIIVKQVISRRGSQQHSHTHAIRTKLFHQFNRIRRVAKLFGHFPTNFIPHNSGKIDVFETFLITVFVAGHNHPRHPKENNIRSGNQVARWVIILNFSIIRIIYSVKNRNWPQPRREPCIQRIFVLTHFITALQFRVFIGFCFCQIFIFSHNNHLLTAIRRSAVVRRNAVSPPKLTADVPVFDVFHPVAVGVFVFFGVKFHRVVFHVVKRRFCQVAHFQEPLHRKFGLDRHIGTFGITHFVGVIFDFFHESGFFQVFHYFPANLKTIHSGIHRSVLVERAVFIENIDGWQVVFFAQYVVVHIVRRSNFQASRSKFHIHVLIFNHRNYTVDKRNNHSFTFQMCRFRVFRMNTHSRVAHYRFGTRSCNDNKSPPTPRRGDLKCVFNLIEHTFSISNYLFICKTNHIKTQ